MRSARRWATRQAGLLETVFDLVDPILRALHPIWRGIGYKRLERPAAAIEALFKKPLFDCQMCGRCQIGASGMTCPMNCPKSMRNGPCGGVRPDGNCEIEPAMPCVWVEAWQGSQRMRGSERISALQPAADHSLTGTSSWLRHIREGREAAERNA
jgi:hypothetical protein